MICIAENSGGKGGVSGGGGAQGQASQSALGAGSASYGYPVIEVTEGQTVTLTVQLTKDYNGEIPADLTTVNTVKMASRVSLASLESGIDIDCSFTAAGVVTIPFTEDSTKYKAGLWYTEFQCKDSTGKLVQVYRAYLMVRKGILHSQPGINPLTAMDVRQAIMDTSPEANQLLDDLEFSDVMIYRAIERCVAEWNETPPAIMSIYSVQTFPYTEHLLQGAVGKLMESIAHRYMRNRMQYAAAGLQLDTSDKGPQYLQLAQNAKNLWMAFIASKKTEENMADCFGIISMPYFSSGNI